MQTTAPLSWSTRLCSHFCARLQSADRCVYNRAVVFKTIACAEALAAVSTRRRRAGSAVCDMIIYKLRNIYEPVFLYPNARCVEFGDE